MDEPRVPVVLAHPLSPESAYDVGLPAITLEPGTPLLVEPKHAARLRAAGLVVLDPNES